MDILDNILYASYSSALTTIRTAPPPITEIIGTSGNPSTNLIANPKVNSDYLIGVIPNAPTNNSNGFTNVFSYGRPDKLNFASFNDHRLIERAINRHWFDIDQQSIYDSDGVKPAMTPITVDRYASFEFSSTYNLMYAYLLENTRMVQIFSKVIEKYFQDEDFGSPFSDIIRRWMENSEKLFFRNEGSNYANLKSSLRNESDHIRRNAYWRMFGMDLSFGSNNDSTITYYKAKNSNQQFIILFERFLTELWKGYINARNTSGSNTTDVNIIVDLSTELRELLLARRGDTNLTYSGQNLGKEEFSSVLINTWFQFILADNNPIIQFLNCQSSSIGERLVKIGNKVGINAHNKSQTLFELALPASTILNLVEIGGQFDNPTAVVNLLSSLNPPLILSPASDIMNDCLTVINNWEKATGHNIKNTEANIRGTVTVQNNGQKVSMNGSMPKPALN